MSLFTKFLALIWTVIALLPAARAEELQKIQLLMPRQPTVMYAPFVSGIKQGFYKAQGLEIELVSTTGGNMVAEMLGAGSAEFGIAGSDSVMIGREKGMPLKMIAQWDQAPLHSIFSLATKGIKKPKDLEGKSFAIDEGSISALLFRAFCKKEGVDISKVKLIPLTGSNFAYLFGDKADSMMAPTFRGAPVFGEKKMEFNEINLADYGFVTYGSSLLTNEKTISGKPELVRKMVKAMVEGNRFAVEHPQETIDAYLERYPDKDRKVETAEFNSYVKTQVSKATKKHGPGTINVDGLAKVQKTLLSVGLLKKEAKIKDVYTSEFLK